MNKRKSARLWTIAILEKLLLIRHSLNYRISKENCIGKDNIDRSNYRLFSSPYTLTKLQSSSITDKKLCLYKVSLARKEYVEPDNTVTRQAISQRNQMQSLFTTDGLLIPIIPWKRSVATQNNCISDKEQHAATILFLDHQQSVLDLSSWHQIYLIIHYELFGIQTSNLP